MPYEPSTDSSITITAKQHNNTTWTNSQSTRHYSNSCCYNCCSFVKFPYCARSCIHPTCHVTPDKPIPTCSSHPLPSSSPVCYFRIFPNIITKHVHLYPNSHIPDNHKTLYAWFTLPSVYLAKMPPEGILHQNISSISYLHVCCFLPDLTGDFRHCPLA